MDFVNKLQEIKEKFELINEKLSDPEILSNQKKLVALGKERSTLEPLLMRITNITRLLVTLKGIKK
jgi:peptide chain release factor 1